MASKSASALVSKILDPIVVKRAGVSMALVNAWNEVVGADLAKQSLPLKVRWPKKTSETDAFEPGVLLIAAEGAAALHLQHQSDQVIERVNAFMGYRAVARIKITQKPVEKTKPRKRQRPLTQSQKRKVEQVAEIIEDGALKESLKRFGQNVMRNNKSR